jgi:hypothetical protein
MIVLTLNVVALIPSLAQGDIEDRPKPVPSINRIRDSAAAAAAPANMAPQDTALTESCGVSTAVLTEPYIGFCSLIVFMAISIEPNVARDCSEPEPRQLHRAKIVSVRYRAKAFCY